MNRVFPHITSRWHGTSIAFIVLGLWAIPARGQAATPTTKVPAQSRSQPVPLKEQIARLQAQIDHLKAEIDSLNEYMDLRAKAHLSDLANGNSNAILGEKIEGLNNRMDALASNETKVQNVVGSLYGQQVAHSLRRTCTVDIEKLRQALRNRYAVSVDVDCN